MGLLIDIAIPEICESGGMSSIMPVAVAATPFEPEAAPLKSTFPHL